MPKATILDRLAGAMETLGKREGKALTPRQRVAAAQRWNSLADIGEYEVTGLEQFANRVGHHGPAQSRYVDANQKMRNLGLTETSGFRADNPFRFDWMGKRDQYEARLKNYRPLTDAQYERMLELEDEVPWRR